MHRFPASPSRALAFALAAALVLGAPASALAHLGLRRAVPADGAHLSVAPRLLKLTFTEAVEAAVARIRLLGPSGAEIPISPLRQPADSAQIILADVRGRLDGGIYRLEWQVVGRDGHPVRGTITYVVAPGATGLDDPVSRSAGAASGVSSESADSGAHHDPTSMPNGEFFGAESPGYVAVRALQFATLLAVIGALAFSFVVLGMLRRTEADQGIVSAMRTRAATLGFWAAIALLVTAVLRLYAQSVAMHGAREALEPTYIAAMIARTTWGWGWVLQFAGALIVIGGLASARRDRAVGWIAAAIGGGLVAVSPALSGHAAATPGRAAIAVIADALHVIGAAGWLGSLLFVLAAGLPVAMALGADRRGAVVARLVNAFSPTALLFAAILVLTGIFAAWLHLGFSSALWTSAYGRTLLWKLAVLAVVLGLGAWNWLRMKPALGTDDAARRLKRSATLELAFAAVIVIITAILVATPPPMDMDGGAVATAEPSPSPG